MRKNVKPVVSALVTAALLAASALPVLAAGNQEITGTDSVSGTIGIAGEVTSGLTITVTVPTAMSFALTPDNPTPVVTAPVEFSNQTKVPVNVSFLGMKATADTPAKVVAPDKFSDWGALKRTDTEANIALGLKDGETVYWSHPEGEAAPADPDGVILLAADGGEGSSKNIDMQVKAGNAWGTSANLSYDMSLKVTLAD